LRGRGEQGDIVAYHRFTFCALCFSQGIHRRDAERRHKEWLGGTYIPAYHGLASEAALHGSTDWLLAIREALFLIQNKLDPASDFIVTLLTLPPTQMLIELAGILVSGLAF
jgi:hypothetical protein